MLKSSRKKYMYLEHKNSNGYLFFDQVDYVLNFMVQQEYT